MLKNSPEFILKKMSGEIERTQKISFRTYKDWLWSYDRTFVFDVIYMNIFSPGTAKMQILEETDIPGYIIETTLEPDEFFKKIYDAKMLLSAAVKKDTKQSLWYREKSVTPEKTSSKEIVFDTKGKIAIVGDTKIRILDSTYDPLSVFFNFLNSDFKIGEPIVLYLLSKRDIYEFKAIPKEIKNNIYKFTGEVYRKNRSANRGASFTLWVKNDKVRIPLLMKVVSAAGPVYLRLKTVK